MGCFYKKRTINYYPYFPETPVSSDQISLIRNVLFINSINGFYQIKRSPPYSNRFEEIYKQELLETVGKFESQFEKNN